MGDSAIGAVKAFFVRMVIFPSLRLAMRGRTHRDNYSLKSTKLDACPIITRRVADTAYSKLDEINSISAHPTRSRTWIVSM